MSPRPTLFLCVICALFISCGPSPDTAGPPEPTPSKSGGQGDLSEVECPNDDLRQDMMITLGAPEGDEKAPASPEDAIHQLMLESGIQGVSGQEFESSGREAPGPYQAEMVRFEDGVLQARFLLERAFRRLVGRNGLVLSQSDSRAGDGLRGAVIPPRQKL